MLLNRFKYNRQNKNQEILKKFCKIYIVEHNMKYIHNKYIHNELDNK